MHHCPAPFGAGYFFDAPTSHHWSLSLARLYPALASPEPIELSFDYAAGALPADHKRLPWDTLPRGAGSPIRSKQTILGASLAAVCQRIRYLTSVCPHGACHLLPHGRCDLPARIVGCFARAADCLVFYTIGRVPSRIHTILHSGLARRQPLPRRFRIPFDDTPRSSLKRGGTKTNHGTLQPCAGTSVASVSSFIAGASQIIIIRPAAFVQRTGKTTSAGLRSARLRGKMSRLWCRQQDLNLRTRKFFISELYPPSFCLHIAPSGRSRSPAHQEKKGEKKKNGDAEFAPASPMIKCVFSIFPLLSGIFKNYFSAISTTQG